MAGSCCSHASADWSACGMVTVKKDATAETPAESAWTAASQAWERNWVNCAQRARPVSVCVKK